MIRDFETVCGEKIARGIKAVREMAGKCTLTNTIATRYPDEKHLSLSRS